MKDFYSQFEVSKPVIIFGVGGLSDLANYVIENDTPFNTVAFTVDKEFINTDKFRGLPILPFCQLEKYYPPNECYLLIPIGYSDINGLRMEKYLTAKRRGYSFVSYLSSRATFWPNVKLGENTMVYEKAVLQPFVELGDNCIIRSAVHLSHHVKVKNHTFVAAGVVTGGNVVIEDRCFVGLGATVLDRIKLAPQTFIGAGALVTKNTIFDGLYIGAPARRLEKRASEVE